MSTSERVRAKAGSTVVGGWLLGVLLLVAFLAPGGLGRLDLCACQGSAHGFFCGGADELQPAPHSCCAEERAGAEGAHPGAQPRGECPDCPRLDMGDGAKRLLPAGADGPTPPELEAIGALRQPLLPPLQSASVASGWPRPPPGKRRLHLLYGVLRL
ncbi:MAG: hypothetical protein KDD82_02900 [Planctomycetes bacterium]|nr:hypothetical protein [Planctomycetota bacterium]